MTDNVHNRIIFPNLKISNKLLTYKYVMYKIIIHLHSASKII